MIVELPRWPLADRLTLVLGLAVGLVLEAVLARYPGAPAGIGAAAAAVLLLWFARQRRRRPLALEFAPSVGRLRFGDGHAVPFVLGPGSRVLGSTVVLHWQSADRADALWLTPADLSHEALRRLNAGKVKGRSVRVRFLDPA
jgi:hypothetical protein